jgi:hypothetical protein
MRKNKEECKSMSVLFCTIITLQNHYQKAMDLFLIIVT